MRNIANESVDDGGVVVGFVGIELPVAAGDCESAWLESVPPGFSGIDSAIKGKSEWSNREDRGESIVVKSISREIEEVAKSQTDSPKSYMGFGVDESSVSKEVDWRLEPRTLSTSFCGLG